ncbi:CYTH and CHAD domain-containing protein [Streptomyces sp. PsTaAH-124]|uniref:CYTH and CHAD domain-containing protein n=1 Tax=Streptomyces sp. PsTaAH-124 TaxID=1157638 RepID=UPI00035E5DD2|nr:CYTH and CHAD domain-containing protein [Streptomyces sp. PsTaAH-124]
MAAVRREIERKYESGTGRLPDLTGVGPVAAVADRGTMALDAAHYDTADARLAAAGLTLRRRTGGTDAGWHLKIPAAPGVRDEIQAPLSDEVPPALAALLRSRVRGAALRPVLRLRSTRAVRHLLDARGTLLAELSVDTVRADRPADTADDRGSHGGRAATARWTEIEVELAEGGDPALLDLLDDRLRAAGVRRSAAPSKAARALAETAPPGHRPLPGPPAPPVTAGDHVLARLRAQRDAVVALDPAVRRDLPDSVHRMRVATRRLRSALRSHGRVLDRAATAPLAAELKWLAGELGLDRDHEVLAERLTAALDALPETLVTGPVRTRLRLWSASRRAGARSRVLAVLDGGRYLALLDALDALTARPPLRPAAGGDPAEVLGRALGEEHARLAAALDRALALPPGPARDLALHEARKQAKRTRYAAETAAGALGAAAGPPGADAKALQTLLGDHQDGVLARRALRELAGQAQAARESSFTYGLLYGREEHRAAVLEAELPRLRAGLRPFGTGRGAG